VEPATCRDGDDRVDSVAVTAAAAPGQPTGRSGGDEVDLLVRRLDPDVPIPALAHPGDAGADLVTTIDVELAAGERATIPTGLAIALPAGFAGFVLPRSGLAARHGLGLVNSPGTIDAGYRGEIMVTLVNHDPARAVRLRRGDRIAQLVVQRVERARFHEVDALPGSARGADGFGSTGGFAESSYGGQSDSRSADDAADAADADDAS
jgi:dUTP pyrophosphatase